jgi:hypothetical protein
MNDAQRLEFLAGQVAALEAFALAVINAHPNVQLLHDDFSRLKMQQESSSLPVPVSEAYLDGQAAVANDLERHLAHVAQNKP